MTKTFVLDTCSIVNGCDLELAGKKLIHWLDGDSDIYVPQLIIFEELETALGKRGIDRREVRHVFDLINVTLSRSEDFDTCTEVTKKWLHHRSVWLDRGETFCLGLSLYLSRKLNRAVHFLTDDFRARKKAADFFMEAQEVGSVLSTPDLILYVYVRNRTVRREQALSALKDFFRKNPAKQVLNVEEKYMNSYGSCCRILGFDKRVCQQQCFVGS